MELLKLFEFIDVLYVKLRFQLMVHFHLKLLLYEVLNLQFIQKVQEFMYQNHNLVKDFIQTNMHTNVLTLVKQ